ncbi:hypothetical protein QBC33DRAFT_577931 [Phialemonium atrogriseum]|uniref:Uncharacterized protein n=1 Tax=Phialemonium atrogriseum TaxID=1093897 RepID=A0AAJ0C229_9PEZI|nr:uncharacterized protein QBC33DRAFT_577931 [Phialemonium atrogriseum]KAK1767673.1 hypothetical protein QBC33DRAFT_577931 [Phialemonium atrogriseum]
MADQFLAEQHAWTLAQNAQVQSDDSSDEENSWVMLGQDGNILPIPNERILHTSRSRVGLDLSTPRELQAAAEPFSIRSDNGIAYVTSKRVIYLPGRPTEQFRSFFAPILNFDDTHVHSSWIGPWSWRGIVKPVAGGGLPLDLPRVEVKLTFKDGGHSEFQTKFELIKDRLHHARDLERETGQAINVTDEPLPPYEASNPSNIPAHPLATIATTTTTTTQSGGPPPTTTTAGNASNPDQAPQPAPDEPPPDYVEAQTQAIGIRYEERMREEAERH